jgi:hypothetical protein
MTAPTVLDGPINRDAFIANLGKREAVPRAFDVGARMGAGQSAATVR